MRFERLFEDFHAALCHNVLPFASERYPSVGLELIKLAEFKGKEEEKPEYVKKLGASVRVVHLHLRVP